MYVFAVIIDYESSTSIDAKEPNTFILKNGSSTTSVNMSSAIVNNKISGTINFASSLEKHPDSTNGPFTKTVFTPYSC